MNHVILIGRLTKDPEIKVTQGKQLTVANFNIAVNRPGTEKATDFINCAAFGKTAEHIDKWCSKGQMVGISGRLQTGSYEKEGKRVFTQQVIVERIDFMSKSEKPMNISAPADSEEQGFIPFSHADDMDIPFE